jgi:hypothetical protein
MKMLKTIFKKMLCIYFLNSFVAIASTPKLSLEKMKYIKNRYEHVMFGREHVFYPAQKAQRLIISFMGAAKGRYSMWTWFWDDKETWKDTAYLFLKDEDICWYVGNNEKSFIEDYSNIIKHYIAVCNVSKNKVFTVGSSMGGYGAILYATLLGLGGAIALNPQIDKASNEVTRYSIEHVGTRWLDLDKVISSYAKVPCLSLIFAYNPKDQAASYTLIDALKPKTGLLVVRRFPSNRHGIAPLVFSKKFVEQEINFLEKATCFMQPRDFIIEESEEVDFLID